jgi:hypothetical protein
MKRVEYTNTDWQAVLEHNKLADYASLWALEADWFEAPNHRRGGWSGVVRYELEDPSGGKRSVFIKRQENHNCKAWMHPRKGIPTFFREFNNIKHYQKCGVPTLNPVFFAYHIEEGKHRCILVTEELFGFTQLDKQVEHWQHHEPPSRETRRAVVQAAAHLTRKMHDHHIQHNCFSPKHLFIKQLDSGRVEARVIDLEKSKWRLFRLRCATRDLYMFNYLSPWWNHADRMYFFLECQNLSRLTPAAKKLWREIADLTHAKGRVKPRGERS